MKRADYQTIVDADGRIVGYRKQFRHPLTKKRDSLRARTLGELFALWDELQAILRRQRAGLLTADDAVEKLAGVKARPAALTFAECWAEYVRHGKPKGESWSAKLAGIWEKHLSKQLGHLAVAEMTYQTMAEWAERLRRPRGPLKLRTVANYFWLVRAAVAQAIRAGRLRAFPWGEFAVVLPSGKAVGAERGAAATMDDLARIVEQCELEDRETRASSPGRLPDLKMRVGLMSLLGLRRGEAAALSWDCVRELPSGDILVEIRYQALEGWSRGIHDKLRATARPQAPPKGNKIRHPVLARDGLGAALLREQRALLESRGVCRRTGLAFYRENGPVFPDELARYRSRDAVRPEKIRRIADAAGLGQVGRWVQHSLRHTSATMHMVAGSSPKETMDFVGHSSLRTLEVYMHRAHGSASGHRLDRAALAALSPAALSPLPLPPVGRPVLDVPAEVVLEATGADAGRAYNEKYFGHKVADFEGRAWREWLAMGAPVEERDGRGKADGEVVARCAPKTVREAAARAGDRARKQEEKNRPETWAELGESARAPYLEAERKRYARGKASTLAAWVGKRNKLALEALERGEPLPEPARRLAVSVREERRRSRPDAAAERAASSVAAS